jgi:hypothetical protein
MPSDWDSAASLLREPRLTLHMPIGSYEPGMECPHHWGYPPSSRLVCSECHRTGSKTQAIIDQVHRRRTTQKRLAARIDAALKADKEPESKPRSKPRAKPRGKPKTLHREPATVVYQSMPTWWTPRS